MPNLLPYALAALLSAAPLLPGAALAQSDTAVPAGEVEALTRTLMLPEMIAVLREEGIDYALTLEADMFPGAGSGWRAAVETVHDLGAMQARFDAAFAAAIGGDAVAVAAAQDFFGSARGQRILTLEIEARRALIDDKVEEAAKVRFMEMEADGDPRVAALKRFAEANDLIEMNVQGALNASLAFYRGLAEGGAPGVAEVPEEQMLSDVWGQEAEVRQETEDWLFPFLAMAYAGLPDDDLDAYTAFSETPEGQRLNAALFAAFDALFNVQSEALGRATARQLLGEDI